MLLNALPTVGCRRDGQSGPQYHIGRIQTPFGMSGVPLPDGENIRRLWYLGLKVPYVMVCQAWISYRCSTSNCPIHPYNRRNKFRIAFICRRTHHFSTAGWCDPYRYPWLVFLSSLHRRWFSRNKYTLPLGGVYNSPTDSLCTLIMLQPWHY